MRILFAAKHPPIGDAAFGGVATWIATLSTELQRRGHECDSWGPGMAFPTRRFDAGVLSNIASTRDMQALCKKAIVVSHGIVDDERPIHRIPTVYTSEEVCRHWGGDPRIIRQPIDMEWWSPGDRARERDTLLFYSYRAKSDFVLPSLAERLGLKYRWIRNATQSDVRSQMRSAALVCASGRAALEAMSCDVPTLVCDWRDYHPGPLIERSIDQARTANYSGRGGEDPRFVDLVAIAKDAMSRQKPRHYVARHHHVEKIASQILQAISC